MLEEMVRHMAKASGIDADDIASMQDSLERVLKPVSANPLLDGRLIEDIEIDGVSDTVVDHKLGRELRGWFLTRKSRAGAAVGDDQANNDTPELTLILLSAAAQTVSIWVF